MSVLFNYCVQICKLIEMSKDNNNTDFNGPAPYTRKIIKCERHK